jgi:hypothetical protein
MAAQFTNLLEFQPGRCASGPPSPGTSTARRLTLACNPVTPARRRKHTCNHLSSAGKQLSCPHVSFLSLGNTNTFGPTTRCRASGENSGNVSSATNLGNPGSDIQLVPYIVVAKVCHDLTASWHHGVPSELCIDVPPGTVYCSLALSINLTTSSSNNREKRGISGVDKLLGYVDGLGLGLLV